MQMEILILIVLADNITDAPWGREGICTIMFTNKDIVICKYVQLMQGLHLLLSTGNPRAGLFRAMFFMNQIICSNRYNPERALMSALDYLLM